MLAPQGAILFWRPQIGAKYTTQAASGYNSSPPPDDGSQSASNLISWAFIKTKLADVIKTLADGINTQLVSAFDYSVRQVTASDAIVAGDHMRCVEVAPTVTVATTLTLPDAATMTNNFRVFLKNSSTATVTVARATGGDTIDGVAASTTMPPGGALLVQTTTGANGYITVGSQPDVKKAAAYQWSDYNPSDVASTTTTAPNTAAATSTATNYVTMANSSGTVTFTFVKAGIYQINLNQSLTIGATSTASESYFNLGGTATRFTSATALRDQNKLNRISNTHTFLVSATANQTLTVQPQGSITSGSAASNFTFSANATAMFLGDR